MNITANGNLSRTHNGTRSELLHGRWIRFPFPTIEALTDDQRLLGDFILVYPTHLFTVMPDSMFYYQVLPSGYDKITLRMHICFPPETMKLPAFEAALKEAWDSLSLHKRCGHGGMRVSAEGLVLPQRATGPVLLVGQGIVEFQLLH